jgi:hypothetical protein
VSHKLFFLFLWGSVETKTATVFVLSIVTKDYLILDFHWKITLPRIEKPVVNNETFFPPPTEIFDFPYAGKVYRVTRIVGPCIVTVNIKYCEETTFGLLS